MPDRRSLSRRAALLAPLALSPLALSGCGLFSGEWFGKRKTPLPGKREAVLAERRGLSVDEGTPKVVLPPAVRNAGWPQAGGNPAHYMGHLAANERLSEAWRSDIGKGGGYRAVITAQPVVANGVVYTMGSDALVSAFRLSDGGRLWRHDTKGDDDRGTNIGGGLGWDGGTLYAVNGLGDLVALDGATGKRRWHANIGAPGRSAPTIAEGRIFLTTIEDRLLALATSDGRQLWNHLAANAVMAMLGEPAPAYSQGLVVAGFGSGELATLRADTGTSIWTDGLGASQTQSGMADFLSIRGLPVIARGQVFAVSMGGLLVGNDLPTGRRLWERQVAGENSPWAAGDWLFVLSVEQELAAIHAADGRVAWITALPRWDDPDKQTGSLTWYGPVLAGDRLVVVGGKHEALSVSPYTGAILGRQSLSANPAPTTPIVADGTLLIVTNDGRIMAMR